MAAVATLPMIFGKQYITEAMLQTCEAEVLTMLAERHKRIAGDNPVIEEFWETYHYINDQPPEFAAEGNLLIENRLNHSNSPDTDIAINIPHFMDLCRTFNQPMFDPKELKKYLPNSSRYPYREQKKVWSRIKKRTLSCWVFNVKQ